MSQVLPTKAFIAYVQGSVMDDAKRPFMVPADVFENRFWSAAGFDWFQQTGIVLRLVDDGGLPKDEATAYQLLIDAARKIRASSEFSESSWVDFFKRYPTLAN